MIAVIFEVVPAKGNREVYLDIAASLRSEPEGIDGFLSVKRLQSLTDPDKLLSLSFIRDEAAVTAWRTRRAHRTAQSRGRGRVLRDYRLRAARVLRDYGLNDRAQVPWD